MWGQMIKKRGGGGKNKPMMWRSWDSLRAKSVHYIVLKDAHSGETARFIELHGDSNLISCLHALYFVSPCEFFFVLFFSGQIWYLVLMNMWSICLLQRCFIYLLFFLFFSIFNLSTGDKQRLAESNIKTWWQGFVTGVRRISTASWWC